MVATAKHGSRLWSAVIIMAHIHPAARGRRKKLRQIWLKVVPVNWAELVEVANPELDNTVRQMQQMMQEL